MITISLCMIVKNGEATIGPCLESVKDVVDEINIVDTGSTDRTVEIVKQYTDRIFHFTWIDDFAAARNYSFDQATKDYAMWLDADDVLLPDQQIKLKHLKETLDPGVDCVTFKYVVGQDENGNPTLVYRRERLVRREKNFKWVGFIHEYIGGQKTNTLDSEITVTHKRVHSDANRNLTIFQRKKAEGVAFTPRDTYYYAKELYYHGMYEEAIPIFEALIESPMWIEEKIDSVCKLADSYCARNQADKAKRALLRVLEWGYPRAEAIYRIGQICERASKYEEAIYWYESILHAKCPEESSGFIYMDYWTWRPYLQLCVCYDRVGEKQIAYECNEKARAINPKESHVVYNVKYFASIGYGTV